MRKSLSLLRNLINPLSKRISKKSAEGILPRIDPMEIYSKHRSMIHLYDLRPKISENCFIAPSSTLGNFCNDL